MKRDRNFRFRGKRDYLHSASLFDDLLQIRGSDARRIDMKFHLRTAHQVSYVEKRPAESALVADWSDAAGRVYVVAREEWIAEREPYDELALVSMLSLHGRTIEIPASTPGFSRIEAIIAGFKHLMKTARPTGRKYVFVRVRMERVPEGAMQIHYARDIGGFFQGDILVSDRHIGQIFFGEWD